jgi:hypothetical protein
MLPEALPLIVPFATVPVRTPLTLPALVTPPTLPAKYPCVVADGEGVGVAPPPTDGVEPPPPQAARQHTKRKTTGRINFNIWPALGKVLYLSIGSCRQYLTYKGVSSLTAEPTARCL